LTEAVHANNFALPSNDLRGCMEILASIIKRRLKAKVGRRGYYAAYENELQRIWPINEENRKAKIAQFAKEHGLHLAFYRPGLCAIFEKEPSTCATPVTRRQGHLRAGKKSQSRISLRYKFNVFVATHCSGLSFGHWAQNRREGGQKQYGTQR